MTEEKLTQINYEKEYVDSLNKKVENLNIQKENLESQIHSLKIHLDGERKLVEQEKNIKFAEERQKLIKMENDFHAKQQGLELKDVHFKEREKTIVQNEMRYAEFLKEREQFNKDKASFQEYKTRVEKELSDAKTTIASISAQKKEIESERQNLVALEKKLNFREDDIDHQLGILEIKKKEFEIYKQSEIERYSVKQEATHV